MMSHTPLSKRKMERLEERTNTIFSPQEFVVNIGPQHPATHGVLRLRTSLDGETVKKSMCIAVMCIGNRETM